MAHHPLSAPPPAPDSPDSATHNASREAKKPLRDSIKQTLSTLTEDQLAAQSRKAQTLLTSLPQYKAATRLSIYLSMPVGECRTDFLVHHALETAGKQVFVPHTYSLASGKCGAKKAKAMDMLRLESIEEFESLERNAWGIPRLPGEGLGGRGNALGGEGKSVPRRERDGGVVGGEGEAEGGLDLVVVPGVAFDAEMNRLGHGAGFYDGYLTRFCQEGKRKMPFLVGLCLAEQVLPSGLIEMQEWDWKVDAVVVGDGRLLTREEVV